MLSYQHIYHAGNRADLHKHGLLCAVLQRLMLRKRKITYIETHAGRGLYDLDSLESLKTGEAALGAQDPDLVKSLPQAFKTLLSTLNHGCDTLRLYPGSPYVAAKLLRSHDRLVLSELHPQEFKALHAHFENDRRVRCCFDNGYDVALEALDENAFLHLDPSYEIKSEYEQIPDFIQKVTGQQPDIPVLIWYPMLRANLHVAMIDQLQSIYKERLQISKTQWDDPQKTQRMYGSGMIGLNIP